MVTDEMVEKAARRMAVADGQNPDKLSHNSFEWWRHYVPMARAALEAALSTSEPVAELQSIDARELDEAIQLLPSVMRPSLSKVIIAAIEEQRRIIAYFKRISRARQLAFEAATTPPAPSVAVKAFHRQADNMAFIINHVGLPDQWREKFMRELDEDRAALSAQVQDVAESELAYKEARQLAVSLHAEHYRDVTQWRPLDDLRGVISQIDNMVCGLVVKPEGWQLVPKELTPAMVQHLQMHTEMGAYVCENLSGAYSLMDEYHRAMLAASPAKQEG